MFGCDLTKCLAIYGRAAFVELCFRQVIGRLHRLDTGWALFVPNGLSTMEGCLYWLVFGKIVCLVWIQSNPLVPLVSLIDMIWSGQVLTLLKFSGQVINITKIYLQSLILDCSS